MARRFQFRLQMLLDVRALREREARRAVAAKAAEIARLDRLGEQTLAEIARQQDVLLRAQQAGRLDAQGLQRGRAWLAHLRRMRLSQQARRAELAAELGELQERLRAARVQTRTIEKLRERRLDEYVRVRERQEQAAADELARQLLRMRASSAS